MPQKPEGDRVTPASLNKCPIIPGRRIRLWWPFVFMKSHRSPGLPQIPEVSLLPGMYAYMTMFTNHWSSTLDANRPLLMLLYYRFLMSTVSLVCYYTYPILSRRHPPEAPKGSKQSISDVTVVCATLGRDSTRLKASIRSWLVNSPKAILVVTGPRNYAALSKHLDSLSLDCIQVLRANEENKREQLAVGFKACSTGIAVVADDDTHWSPTVLQTLVEAFAENESIGAVFPEVKLHPVGKEFNFWEMMAAIRLFGNCVDIRTSMLIDGGMFCASGTTAAYRARVVKDPGFLSYFLDEHFLGAKLNAGDDQSFSSWLCRQGWEVALVEDGGPRNCRVKCTPRATWLHLFQLARWSRSDWISYINALLFYRTIWRRYPFTAHYDLMWCMETFAPIIEAFGIIELERTHEKVMLVAIIGASRILRYLPEILSSWKRAVLLPLIAVYLYVLELVKLYALLTLSNVSFNPGAFMAR
ncbi:nucleotide-diphospho-sugar transferase [Xylariaceae sp. FL0016]|nr:nucleotide-diphospho-sugar transferase [Xylariaceae sp. FL0016]